MTKILALIAALASPTGFHSSAKPLPAPVKAQLKSGGFWHKGCPVGLSGLRLLTVAHRGWDGRTRTGQLIVNAGAAQPLRRTFRQLYRLRFPIRHMRIADFYGPKKQRPKDGDVTASFECRQAAASPCTGGGGTGTWSQHAYGLAVDVNPGENPYVGCGQSRDPTLKKYRDRSRHLKGMVTPRARAAFADIGWGWGGSWAGDTKDYMHFSSTGG
jgi:hypothetical protein